MIGQSNHLAVLCTRMCSSSRSYLEASICYGTFLCPPLQNETILLNVYFSSYFNRRSLAEGKGGYVISKIAFSL